MLKQTDIIRVFQEHAKDANVKNKWASFDYIYNYFFKLKTQNQEEDIEKSCVMIGYYLAVNGKFYENSTLLKYSIQHYRRIVDFIYQLPKSIWDIDVNMYTLDNMNRLIYIYNKIKERLLPEGEDDIEMITTLMQGVFGNVTVFNEQFCNYFSELFKGKCDFKTFDIKALECVTEFYLENDKDIDYIAKNSTTGDFLQANLTGGIKIKRARVIDIYGSFRNVVKVPEMALEIFSEVGNLIITRIRDKGVNSFRMYQTVYDTPDRSKRTGIDGTYSTFEEAFSMISDRFDFNNCESIRVHRDYEGWVK